MTAQDQTTLQEIYFDLCDLIESGQAHDIADRLRRVFDHVGVSGRATR